MAFVVVASYYLFACLCLTEIVPITSWKKNYGAIILLYNKASQFHLRVSSRAAISSFFLGFAVFFFIMRHIATFEFLFLIDPAVQVIPDFGTLLVSIELGVLFLCLTYILFHKKGLKKHTYS